MINKRLELSYSPVLGEHREFVFTAESTVTDAHIVETQASRARRGKEQKKKERDGRDDRDDMSTPAAAGKDTGVPVVA